MKQLICFLLLVSNYFFLAAQVTYDNNATSVGSSGTTLSETISSFVVPSGDDRLLVVYVTFEQSGSPTVSGITYNGNSLSQGVAARDGTLYSQIWYLVLGDGGAITSDIVATFTNNPNVVVGAASYRDVDQLSPFETTKTGTGRGTSPSISVSTSSSDHLIVANLALIASDDPVTSAPTAAGQTEILETTNGHDQTGAASHLTATGGSDVLSWTLSEETDFAIAAAELALAPVCDPSTATLPTTATTYTSSYSTEDGDGWTHYCDGNGNLLLSLKLGGTGADVPDNGVSVKISSPTAQFHSSGTGFVANSNGAVFFNRTWNVSPDVQPSSNVPVRFYFTAAEYAAVNSELTSNGLTTMSSETEILFYKATAGGAHAAISSLTANDVIQLTNGSSSTTTWALGSHNSDHYAEFQVASFSGGGGG